MQCPFCKGKEWQPSNTDLGMPHWKADKIKPIRMQLKRCLGCGFIAMFAPLPPKEEK